MEREHFGSRLGFILLSAGCAIGLGNVYRFPMKAGQYGGGAFVLIYVACLILLGLPVMVMEFSLGRAAQKSPVGIYKSLTPERKAWRTHGYLSLIANILLMAFYTTIAGWIFRYFFKACRGQFTGLESEAVTGIFLEMLGNPWEMIIFTAIIAGLACFICSFSLQKGLEAVTKYMMVALLVLMVGLAIYGCTLDGAKEGLSFYLKPDFSLINAKVVSEAMNQSFFTLSLGIGSMAIFGSYIGKERSLTGESITIIILDTFVAIVAGLIIFPACFTYGIEPNEGASLIFLTLPNVFNGIPGGAVLGALFFIFMTFAAFSTVLAVYENIIACTAELFKWSRKKTALIIFILMVLANVPFILGNNVWSNFHAFGIEGKDVSDLEDFFVSTIMLPLGSLTYVIYCTRKIGWGWENFIAEANTGKGIKFPKGIKPYVGIILPLVILVVFVLGLLSYFGLMK